LNTAAIENKDGTFVAPSQRTCRRGLALADMPENLRVFVPDPDGLNSYPIVTFSWVLLRKKYKDPETANALRELFQWSLKEGQLFSVELGYIQLPASVTEKALAALNKIEADS
jgi:phosphate transport system substrate-binding protein